MPQRDLFVVAKELADTTIARERADLRARFFRMTKPRKQPTVTPMEVLALDEPAAIARLDQEIGSHGEARVARSLGVESW